MFEKLRNVIILNVITSISLEGHDNPDICEVYPWVFACNCGPVFVENYEQAKDKFIISF